MHNKYFFLFCLIASVIFGCFSWGACQSAPQPTGKTVTVEIPQGSGLTRITQILEDQGVIKHPRLFWFRVRLQNKQNQLKAGSYSLTSTMSHGEILELLLSGKVIRHKVTIPEGLTFKEIANLLNQTGMIRGEEFIQECQNPSFLQQLNLPIQAKSVEGFLFPSTYFLAHHQPARDLIQEMVQNYQKIFSPDLVQRAGELGLDELEVVTLASIIEKETGLASERKRISSVFHNRLQRGMRLQTDPTVIYGIANFNGNLTRKDLETYTPYNTYMIPGLPPGPIANAGKEALLAALYPEDSPYLFFVSKNDGSHYFSSHLREHERAVDRFQRKRRR